MRIDSSPFPPWPTHSKPTLTKLELIKETEHHTLSLQHFTITPLNQDGSEGVTTNHDYDVVKPKETCPAPLAEDGAWERVLSDPVDLGGLKYKRVVRIEYRNKISGVVVCLRPWLRNSMTDDRIQGKWLFGNHQSFLAVRPFFHLSRYFFTFTELQA